MSSPRGRTPAVPRDAATVILLRQAPDVEAFLLRRTDALEFAPGACVFPGGSVDERDGDGQIGWAGRSPAEFAGLARTRRPNARAPWSARPSGRRSRSPACCSPDPRRPSWCRTARRWRSTGRALLEGSCSLAELLGRRGLVLRADLLTPWARWVTPEFSPRRFDTWFFASPMPPGQVTAVGGADHGPAESVSGSWLKPSEALEAARAGQITLLPPTAVTLAELAGHQDVTSILAQRRVITPLLPKVVVEQERAWLALPEATKYPL